MATSAMATAGGIVINASELNRMKLQLSGVTAKSGALTDRGNRGLPDIISRDGSQTARGTQEVRALELHKKSQARAETWGNTLAGSRRRKAEEKRRKLELEELERQRIDAEEAKIQLEQRKSTIDRANKLLYDESDRIKSFHSSMMLCDVLHEREAQMNIKEEAIKLEAVREDRFLEMEKQSYRKMLERELSEKEKKQEMSRIAATLQKQQLHEFKEKRFKEVEEAMLEGELLRRKALEDYESERKEEGKRRECAVHALIETKKANDYLKVVKQEEVQRQLKEEDKIKEFSAHKEEMLELRRKRADEVHRAKQATRQAMIDAQSAKLAEIRDEEDERVNLQVQEKEMAREENLREKAALNARQNADMHKSRQQQIERRRQERERAKVDEKEAAEFGREWCKVLDKQEHEEFQLKAEANRSLAMERKAMVGIKTHKKETTKTHEEQVALRAKKAMEADTLEFHGYAEDQIRSYAQQGKNVIPLIKELREFRKRVLE